MSEWLERVIQPSRATLESMRMASVIRINEVIHKVRELRDAPMDPTNHQEPAELIQQILTELSALKGGLLFRQDG